MVTHVLLMLGAAVLIAAGLQVIAFYLVKNINNQYRIKKQNEREEKIKHLGI